MTAEWLTASLTRGKRQAEDEYPPLELPRTLLFAGHARPSESDIDALAAMGADAITAEGSPFLEGATLVMKKLRRGERFLSACAAGSWCVSPSTPSRSVCLTPPSVP